MLVSKKVAGKDVEVPLEECWDSLCRMVRICWLLTCVGGKDSEQIRLAFLRERMNDLEGLHFHYKMHPFDGGTRQEEFVEAHKKD
jgi:hypothetical protein